MNFSIKNYPFPTPNSLRILGDFIVTSLGGISVPVVLNQHPTAGVALVILGIVGKFLSNCFGEPPKNVS